MKLKNIAMVAVLISAAFTATKDASAQVTVPADNQPAVAPSPPNANPATYIASNSFTANWSGVSGATGYRLDVSTNNSFNNYVGVYHDLNVGNATSRSVTGLNVSTTYHYRVRAYNGAGTSGNSNIVNVTTLTATGPPVVYTNPATLVASFSATLNGSVDPHGLSTTVYFQWGTTTSYERPPTPPQNRGNGNTYQNITANVTGLNANTTYHFRIVATNSQGMRFGNDRTFTTLSAMGPPVVITNPASLVASFSATLNGSVDPHGLATTVYFQWGTTTSYERPPTPPQNRGNGNTYQNVTANITALNANTTYHFRIVATNSQGMRFGNDRTFTTLSAMGPPVVITNPATNVARSSATLNSMVDPHGSPTTVHFQWGTTNTYGHDTPNRNRIGDTFQNVVANISGLNANTTYHFQIVATNDRGMRVGLDRTFRTLASVTPTATPTATVTATRTPTATPTATHFPTPTATAASPSPLPSPSPMQSPTPTCIPGVTPGPWSTASPYPTPIARYGFAGTASYFYVFGGVSNGSRVSNVNFMDTFTEMWQSRAPMPFTSEAPACALMPETSFVYCAEGDTGSGFARYDIFADTWTPLAPVPGGDHYGSAAGAFNGKVFVAGGTTGIVNTVQVYDVATNTWSSGTGAPGAFLLAGYQQVGQYLYVVGGFTSSPNGPGNSAEMTSVLYKGPQRMPNVPLANLTTSWRLDMSSAPGVWSVGPAFTQARADFGLAYDYGTNKLYAMGGDAAGGTYFDSTNLVDELALASWPGGTWVASPPNLVLPNRQANQAGFFAPGQSAETQIWSVGGIAGQTLQFLSEVQRRANGQDCLSPTPTAMPTATATPTIGQSRSL